MYMEKSIHETPRFEVRKVKVKNDQLTADYTEKYPDANYKNEVTKASEQYIHPDLKYALGLLKPHVALICEMPEAGSVKDVTSPSDGELNETLDRIIVTGYSKGGNDDSAGVCIIAQRILKTGQVLNITTPFTKFDDEIGDGYPYGGALKSVVERCDYEVDAYLFEEKWGLKQLELEFESDGETSEIRPKKRGRKKKVQGVEGFGEPEEAGEGVREVELEMPL
jgi:hypothetical protein